MKKAILFFASLVALCSCVTYNKCIDKFGVMSTDSVPVYVNHHVNIKKLIAADSVESDINLDTLCARWKHSSTILWKDSLRTTSESGKMQINYWVDSYNKLLRVKARKQIDTVFIKTIVRDTVNCPPVVVLDQRKSAHGIARVWEQFQLFAPWALIFQIVLIALYLTFRRK